MRKKGCPFVPALGRIAGSLLICFAVLGGIPFSPAGGEVTASGAGGIVWLSDQNASTILQTLPLTRNGSTQSPLLVYDAAAEQEIIHFISRLDPPPAEVRVVETVAGNVPAAFLGSIAYQTGVNAVRAEPIDDYVFHYWQGKAGAPSSLVVADQTSFMPYAAVWAHRQSGAFVDTYAKAERLVLGDGDIASISYFGTNAATAASLEALASASGKSMQRVASLDEAVEMLTPARSASTQNVVALIHSNDTGALTASQQYWKIAPIYAALRHTMLLTVSGGSVADIDADLDQKLDRLIIPNSGGQEPGHLVIIGHWAVFPYRFADARFPYMLSADARYADRNNDGDYVPEIPFGRITAYDIGNAVLLMNKGFFFDSGAMGRAERGVLASDWLVERETETISALQTMYGPDNVYARGDIEFSNSLTNNPPLAEVLAEAKTAEVVILTGHGSPNYLAATNPATRGQDIKNRRFYPPSFWWFNGCDTGSYYPYGTSLVSGALASGAVNILAAVDTVATHSSALSWYPGYLAQGNDIGTMLQRGYKACEAYYGSKLNVNKLPQIYLIGDPLVNYPPESATLPPNEPPGTPIAPTGAGEGIVGVEYTFVTQATDAEGSALTYTFDWGDGETVTVGPAPSGTVVRATHAWKAAGVYAVKAFATDSQGASSDWSEVLLVNIVPPPPQMPWKENESGAVFTDRAWDYTLGYEFTPEADGAITGLGGNFNGSKTVSLWNAQGNLLASIVISSANEWNYEDLPVPVAVKAGQSYRVTVYTAGSGAAYVKSIEPLPRTYGEITIRASCYRAGEGFPTLKSTDYMFGQVDIVFVPGG